MDGALGKEGAILQVVSDADRLKAIAAELSEIASSMSPVLFTSPHNGVDGSAALIESQPDKTGGLVATARGIYRSRRLRARIFEDDSLFGEPAWDMLLDLFVSEAEDKPLSVTAACIGSGVPSSTALRWLVLLEQRGLVERHADRRDARRVFLGLTDKGRSLMTDWLQQASLLSALQAVNALA